MATWDGMEIVSYCYAQVLGKGDSQPEPFCLHDSHRTSDTSRKGRSGSLTTSSCEGSGVATYPL